MSTQDQAPRWAQEAAREYLLQCVRVEPPWLNNAPVLAAIIAKHAPTVPPTADGGALREALEQGQAALRHVVQSQLIDRESLRLCEEAHVAMGRALAATPAATDKLDASPAGITNALAEKAAAVGVSFEAALAKLAEDPTPGATPPATTGTPRTEEHALLKSLEEVRDGSRPVTPLWRELLDERRTLERDLATARKELAEAHAALDFSQGELREMNDAHETMMRHHKVVTKLCDKQDDELADLRTALTAANAEAERLRGLLGRLVGVIDSAGVDNLMRGVQLGQISWFHKATDAMTDAHAALAARKGTT